MEKFSFKVNDMTCEGCAGKIRTALENSDQIDTVHIDVATHMVNVTGVADKMMISGLIRSIGFNPEDPAKGFLGKLFGKS